MKEHKWSEERFEGSVIAGKMWVCKECGCYGGPVFKDSPTKPKWRPYLAGVPVESFSDDCEDAKKQIDEFVAKFPSWKEHIDRVRT